MDYVPYWILLAITVLIAIITTIYFRKFRFIDFQDLVMFWAISFSLDMLFCKWLGLYHWVNTEHGGFYSFWVCLLFYPSVSIIFLAFRPKRMGWFSIYISLWIATLTAIELYVISPLGIVAYPKWKILPWSPIGYTVVLAWIHTYNKVLQRKLRAKGGFL